MIEQEFRNLVASKTTWTVYLNRAIENQEAPYLVVHKVSAPRSMTHNGRDGRVVSRFQVDAYASDYKTIKEEAYKIYSVADSTSSTISFISLENEIDMFDSVSELHHVVLDFIVNYYE